MYEYKLPAWSGKLPPWAGKPVVVDEKDIADTVSADVVVVGSGNAGVLAAAAAAFAGDQYGNVAAGVQHRKLSS